MLKSLSNSSQSVAVDRFQPKSFNSQMVKRVLILEDEVMIADLTERMVRELGYDIAGPVHHRDAGLEAINQNNFDVALVDMSMDGKECPEIPDRLIELGRPFAFVTGFGKPRQQRHSYIQVLQKPFKLDDLERLLATLALSK